MHDSMKYGENSTYSHTRKAAVSFQEVAVVGLGAAFFAGVASAAKELRKKDEEKKELCAKELALNISKEALGTGLSAAIGTAVGASLFKPGFLSYTSMALVGMGVKYFFDEVVESSCPCFAKSKAQANNK